MSQTINVDITPNNFQPTLNYSQGDVGRTFSIKIVSQYGDTLPSGATVKIQATKPSGFGFDVEADSVTDNVATFTTTAEMTDEWGRFPAQLDITKDAVTIFSAKFLMVGAKNTHPEGTIDGSQGTIIPELTLLVERVEAAASSVLDMEVEAQTLPAGSLATYSYDEDENKATFGIPQGEAGAGAAGVTASAYSASRAYAVGEYVIHNNNLYRCTTAITTAEAFTAAHWTQVVLSDDVSDLKSALNEMAHPLDIKEHLSWCSGYINTVGGVLHGDEPYSNRFACLPNYDYGAVLLGNDRQACVAYFNKTTGAFVGRTSWTQDTIVLDPQYTAYLNVATVAGSSYSTDELIANINIIIDKDLLMSLFKKTVWVQDGWVGAISKPQNYYVHTEHMDFKEGDVLTAKNGYQLALMDSLGQTTQPWFDTYTFTEDTINYGIIIRRTGASAPIDKNVDGLTLLSYCEGAYTSVSDSAYIPNDKQMQYIFSLTAFSRWKNKKVAFVGDSITYGVNTSQGNIYYQILNDMIGFSNVYADGVAGSCYSATSNYGTSITPIVNRWSNIPTDRDLIVIFAGTNDYGHNTPLGTIADTTDVSFYGAMSVVINGILEANPSGRLVLFTPLHRYNYTDGAYPNDTQPNGQGHTLKDYVDAIKDIAEMYGVPIVDLFSTACLNPRISAIKTNYVTDGLHPNSAGHHLLAERIAPLLETM